METVEEKSLACIRSFDYLSKELKNIENVPLDITAVLSVDSVFRYCDVNPPLSNASKVRIDDKTIFLTSKVMNGIIQLSKLPLSYKRLQLNNTIWLFKVLVANGQMI